MEFTTEEKELLKQALYLAISNVSNSLPNVEQKDQQKEVLKKLIDLTDKLV